MNSEISKVIGKRINALLAKKFKRQKDLATALGVNDNTISYFVSGKRMPNTEQIIKISDFFGVSADYLLGLSDTPTADKDIQFICEYTGLTAEAIENLKKGKNAVFNTTLLNFLINNKKLLKALNNYLLSSIYSDYCKSEYMYLPLKDKAVFIRNPDIAQKVAYSNLLEVLPLQKEKMTEQIKDNEELKGKLLFALAKKSVDLQECKKEEIKIYGIENYLSTPEELEEYYNSEQFEQDELQNYYDELEEYEEHQRAIEKFEEEMFKREDFILWFMSELSKEKDGENNVNNP